ncbi:hypothetical protein B0H65DRAFT_430385 [Neurospora tetraspora]|uniref:Uncharacterized protein n=1 Tax=Neurospora tetraspora TaxID=94610 RepID=A0AAE0MR75_9PEZI|nr:hypothetical protein B0H65DRAFT_430385 [Neurospora tetraspora]
MAPFSLPRGSKRRVETKQSHLTSRDSLIGGGTHDAKGRTDGGKLTHQSETTYRQRTTTYGGKNTVTHSGKRNDTTSKGSKGGDGGENTNQDGKGDANNNNEAGGKTGCGKFDVFCRGNRTSGNGKNNDGDASDKGDGKEEEEDREDDGRKNSSSRPTNKPESTIMILSIPGKTSLVLVSEPTQAPTPSFTPDVSATSMGSLSLEAPSSFTTSYVPQATYPDQAISAPEEGNQESDATSVKGDWRHPDWQNLNDSSKALNHPSPVSERTETVAHSESVGSVCSYEKVDDLLQQGYQPHTPGIQIQYQQPNPVHQHCGSPVPYATFANVAYPANIVDTRNLTSATMYSHQHQQLSTSTNPSQNNSLTTTTVSNGTRQIQYVSHYDPKYLLSPCSTFEGRGKRMSDISSLSSGFGDGDIILPEQTLQPPQPAAIAYPSSPNGNTDRFSGLSTQRGGQRDTLYTESSEDSPARFRSLNSWVAQQSGRVRRGQERDEASYLASLPQLPCQPGVPGIHNPPVEQTFALMRDDEKPRPVEEIIIRMR